MHSRRGPQHTLDLDLPRREVDWSMRKERLEEIGVSPAPLKHVRGPDERVVLEQRPGWLALLVRLTRKLRRTHAA